MGEGLEDQSYRFGPFRVDPEARLLLRDGSPVPLLPKSFDVLLVLVRHSGRLLDKDFLLAEIWPDTHVEENNLARAISDIRKALGEGPKDQKYVLTVPRRGYRFAATVETGAVAGNGRVAEHGRAKRRGYGVVAAAIAIGLLSAGAIYLFRQPPAAAPLSDADVLVLADFTNNTGDPVFDGTLREALAVQLEHSPFLRVMADSQVRQSLRLMGRAPDAPLTNEVAREVCVRERQKAMIGGSIASLGGSYAIILHATNCVTGDTLAREQVESTDKTQVLGAIARGTTSMRRRLGESLNSIEQLERHAVTQVTTPSLEAFQAYALGTDRFRRGLWLQACPFFARAAELDPNFAMAFQMLSTAYGNAGDRVRSTEYSKRAFALIDRVSERERLAIAAPYHMGVTGDAAQSAAALELFVQTFPRVPMTWAWRGSFYMSMGAFERAAQDFAEILRLDPRSWIGYINVMDTDTRLGRFEQVKAVARTAFARGLDVPLFHQVLLHIALMEGEEAAAAKEIAWLDGTDDEYVSLDLQASQAIVRGQRRQAADLLRRAADQARRQGLHGPAGILTAAAAADPFGDCQVEDGLVSSLRACADVQAALAEAEALLKERPADTLLIAVHVPVRRAAIALRQHQPAKAIELLEAAAPFERRYPEVIYLRGLAYLRAGKGVDAAAELRKIVDHKGATWGPRYPLAFLGLARAAVQTDDIDAARKAYQALLALWTDADPDLPVLIEAQREAAALR